LTDKIEPAAREIVKRLNPGGLAKAANQGSVKTPPHQGAGKKSRNKAKPPPKGANQ
jgi:hypothetical protein